MKEQVSGNAPRNFTKLYRCFSNELTVLITVLFFFPVVVYSGKVEEEYATTRPGFCVPYNTG